MTVHLVGSLTRYWVCGIRRPDPPDPARETTRAPEITCGNCLRTLIGRRFVLGWARNELAGIRADIASMVTKLTQAGITNA
jgi:hypothetical protein